MVVPLAVAGASVVVGTRPVRIIDFVSEHLQPERPRHRPMDRLADAFRHMILPAIALGTIPLAIIARITPARACSTCSASTTSGRRARGLSDRAVVRRHGLPNAMLPVVTIVGLQLGGLLGGAVLTETIFNLAGVGRAVSEGITELATRGDPGVRSSSSPSDTSGEPPRRRLVRVPRSADPPAMRPVGERDRPGEPSGHREAVARPGSSGGRPSGTSCASETPPWG